MNRAFAPMPSSMPYDSGSPAIVVTSRVARATLRINRVSATQVCSITPKGSGIVQARFASFAIRIIQYVRSSRDGIDEPRADFDPAYRLIVGHVEKRSVTPNPARHLEPRRLSPAIEGARPAWFPGKCGHCIFGSTGNLRGKYREWQEVASFRRVIRRRRHHLHVISAGWSRHVPENRHRVFVGVFRRSCDAHVNTCGHFRQGLPSHEASTSECDCDCRSLHDRCRLHRHECRRGRIGDRLLKENQKNRKPDRIHCYH